MSDQFPHIFSPFKIRNAKYKNRIFVSAHLTCFAIDRMPTERSVAYFAERAKGGAALIITALNLVRENSYLWPAAETAFRDEIIPHYKRITDAVHEHRAKIFYQLAHMGRQMSSMYSKLPIVSSTDIPCPVMLEMPKIAEEEDIERTIQDFAGSAVTAKKGGFDGVEIHSS